MKNLLRLLVFAVAATAALALSGTAMAQSYTSPRLVVDNPSERVSGGGPVRISVSVARTDLPTAQVRIYVPTGYNVSLVHPAGTQLGTVSGQVNATAAGPDVVIPVEGPIQAQPAANFTAPAAQCLGPGAKVDAVWLLVLGAAGQTLNVPMYVTTLTEDPTAGRFAVARLTVCLPPPATAQFGAKLLSAQLNVQNVFTNPAAAGSYRWRALFTPYASNAGPANPAGTVEAQSIDHLPVRVAIAGRARGRNITIVGALAEVRAPVARATVQIWAGTRAGRLVRLGTLRTNNRGLFGGVVRVRRAGTYFFQARATRAARSGTCTATFPQFACVGATIAAFNVRSATIRVRVR